VLLADKEYSCHDLQVNGLVQLAEITGAKIRKLLCQGKWSNQIVRTDAIEFQIVANDGDQNDASCDICFTSVVVQRYLLTAKYGEAPLYHSLSALSAININWL